MLRKCLEKYGEMKDGTKRIIKIFRDSRNQEKHPVGKIYVPSDLCAGKDSKKHWFCANECLVYIKNPLIKSKPLVMHGWSPALWQGWIPSKFRSLYAVSIQCWYLNRVQTGKVWFVWLEGRYNQMYGWANGKIRVGDWTDKRDGI